MDSSESERGSGFSEGCVIGGSKLLAVDLRLSAVDLRLSNVRRMDSFSGYFFGFLSLDFNRLCSGDCTIAMDSTEITEDFDSFDDDSEREVDVEACKTFVAAAIHFWLATTDSTAVKKRSMRISMAEEDLVNSSLTDWRTLPSKRLS